MNTSVCFQTNKSYLLVFYILMNFSINAVGQTLNNNRNGLIVNVKYDAAVKSAYLDFNSLTEKTETGYKTDDEIRAYLKAYPEMLEIGAIVDKVSEKYPHLFQDALKAKYILIQETEKIKKSATKQ